jgi:hypothetical protein
LLTGASAVALSVAASTGQAAPQTALPTWTVWGEGAAFWTGGGNFNIPGLLGSGFTSFKPLVGAEGAVGFDYRWPSQPWHFVFDFRYGKTRNRSATSSSFHSSLVPTYTGFATQTTSTGSNVTEHESHLVSDFMIGRDLGIGTDRPELEFGIRIADLYATAHAAVFNKRTFYSSGVGIVTVAQSATGDWNSRFFGIGPRLAIVGGIPIVGEWSFDYGAGIAALIGRRKLDGSTTTGFTVSDRATAVVFNADGWLAFSFRFAPQFKISSGIRGDFYNNALTTYDISGALKNIDRLYWGPFVRLTGTF